MRKIIALGMLYSSGLFAVNAADRRIVNDLLPKIEMRLLEASRKLTELAEKMSQNPVDPEIPGLRRKACETLSRSKLMLSAAFRKSVGGEVFKPYSPELSELEQDITSAFQENGCN